MRSRGNCYKLWLIYLWVCLLFEVRSCPVAQAGEACSSSSGIPNPDCTSKPALDYCCESVRVLFLSWVKDTSHIATDKVYPLISVHLKGGRIDPRCVWARLSSALGNHSALCAHGAHNTCRQTHTQKKNKLKRKENHHPWSPASAELFLPRQLGDFCGVGWSAMVRPVGAY